MTLARRFARFALLLVAGSACTSSSDAISQNVDSQTAKRPSPATPKGGDTPARPFDPTDATAIDVTGPGYTVMVDKSANRGTWEGWGASLAWWGKAIGTSTFQDTYADLLFTDKDVRFFDRVLPGLGLNIVRYNVGGGGHPGDVAGVTENVPAELPWYKNIEGYWLNWNSTTPTSASWDFSRDANQRAMLLAAKSRGVDKIELFSDSPMWWMMDSKSNAGGNLQSWNRRDHARYLASVVKHARDAWGVDVGSVEPFNEPSAGWWQYPKNQEGCNMPKEEQAEVLEYLREEMHARGLDDVVIAASDENTMTQAISSYEYFKGQRTAAGQATSDLEGQRSRVFGARALA